MGIAQIGSTVVIPNEQIPRLRMRAAKTGAVIVAVVAVVTIFR